jgi:hypothetical protein
VQRRVALTLALSPRERESFSNGVEKLIGCGIEDCLEREIKSRSESKVAHHPPWGFLSEIIWFCLLPPMDRGEADGHCLHKSLRMEYFRSPSGLALIPSELTEIVWFLSGF